MIKSPLIFFLNTNGVFLFLLGVILYFWIFKKKKGLGVHILFSALLAGMMSLILKELFDFPRPFILDGGQPLAGFWELGGFPSLHASIAFSVAVTTALHERKTGIILLILASLISVGRVVANMHYPLDVLGGIILGSSVSFLVENVHFPPLDR